MREKMKFVLKVVACLASAVVVGCILIILAYLIPTGRIRSNVAASAQQVSDEGTYYQWANGYKNAQSDNYTDASLILNAMYPTKDSAIQDAMNVPRKIYGDDNNEESVAMAAQELEGETQDIQYGRYWHGSLILLKPLLFFFDLADIRIINMIVQLSLLTFIIIGFCKRKMEKQLVGFMTAVIMLNPITTIFCLCFSIEYILMLIAVAAMLLCHEYLSGGNRYYFFFLWCGIAFVYFNELSFPMIGLGIPLVVYLLLSRESMGQLIKKEICFGALWGIGYSIVWLGKWTCAFLFTGMNYIKEAIDQATRYTSQHATWEVENPTTWQRLYRNISMYLKWPYLLIAVILFVIFIFCLVRQQNKLTKEKLTKMIPFALIVLLPFAIFIALGNGYSYVHYWFTHKLLSISAFAGIAMLLQLLDAKA